jgi:hypothetical protein
MQPGDKCAALLADQKMSWLFSFEVNFVGNTFITLELLQNNNNNNK